MRLLGEFDTGVPSPDPCPPIAPADRKPLLQKKRRTVPPPQPLFVTAYLPAEHIKSEVADQFQLALAMGNLPWHHFVVSLVSEPLPAIRGICDSPRHPTGKNSGKDISRIHLPTINVSGTRDKSVPMIQTFSSDILSSLGNRRWISASANRYPEAASAKGAM